jgi:hypothetical protein
MENAYNIKDKGVYRIEKDKARVKIEGKIYTKGLLRFFNIDDAEKCKLFMDNKATEVKIVKTDEAFYCYRRNKR